MKRRKFIGMLAGAGACLAATPAAAGGNHHFTGYPGSFGVLFDSTKCIGCRKCEAACSRVNELPPQPQPFDDLTIYSIATVVVDKLLYCLIIVMHRSSVADRKSVV